MSISGSMTEGDLPTEKQPEPEKTSIAKLLFSFSGLYERWRNEYEARSHKDGKRGPDPDYAPTPLTEEDITRLIRTIAVEQGLGGVNFGNHGEPRPKHNHRSQASEILLRIGIGILTGMVGFAYGRLWDHEHRISVLEGREVPSVRSP